MAFQKPKAVTVPTLTDKTIMPRKTEFPEVIPLGQKGGFIRNGRLKVTGAQIQSIEDLPDYLFGCILDKKSVYLEHGESNQPLISWRGTWKAVNSSVQIYCVWENQMLKAKVFYKDVSHGIAMTTDGTFEVLAKNIQSLMTKLMALQAEELTGISYIQTPPEMYTAVCLPDGALTVMLIPVHQKKISEAVKLFDGLSPAMLPCTIQAGFRLTRVNRKFRVRPSYDETKFNNTEAAFAAYEHTGILEETPAQIEQGWLCETIPAYYLQLLCAQHEVPYLWSIFQTISNPKLSAFYADGALFTQINKIHTTENNGTMDLVIPVTSTFLAALGDTTPRDIALKACETAVETDRLAIAKAFTSPTHGMLFEGNSAESDAL